MSRKQRKSIRDWAEYFGVNYRTFRKRAMKLGLTAKRRNGRGVLLTRRQAERCLPPRRAARRSKSANGFNWREFEKRRRKKLRRAGASRGFDWTRFEKRIPKRTRRRQTDKRYDWSKVDWRERDVEIAEELGCSDTAVSRMRKRRGKPKASGHGRKRSLDDVIPRIDEVLRDRDPHTSDRTIARRLAKEGIVINERFVARRRRALGIPAVEPRGSIWSDLVDWRLVNKDIQKIWKVRTVGAFREYHAGRVRPMFTYGTGRKGENKRYYNRMKNPKYRAIYRAQEKLAKRHGRSRKKYRRY